MTSSTSRLNENSKLDEFALSLFACLLIAAGAWSVVGMVYNLIHDSLKIDLGFLGILIGKGLLDRKEHWRKWAVFLAWAGIICSLIIGVLITNAGSQEPIEVKLYGLKLGLELPSYAAFIPLSVWLAFSLWQRSVLTKPSVRCLFTAAGTRGNIGWSALTAMAILFSCVEYTESHLVHRILKSIGHHETTLYVVDAGTGSALNPSVSGPSRSSEQILPKVSFGFKHSDDGISLVNVSWLASGPITLHVSSDGYLTKKVVLNPEHDGEDLRIELESEEVSNKAIDSEKN